MKKKTAQKRLFRTGEKGYLYPVIRMKRRGQETQVLKPHWGCSCCDRDHVPEDVEFSKRVVEALNAYASAGNPPPRHPDEKFQKGVKK